MDYHTRETTIEVAPNIFNNNKYHRTILNDLASYDFSDDIKYRANHIYTKMKISTRSNNRTLLLFFCIYNAHKELSIPITPKELGPKFGLKNGEMQKTMSLFTPLQTGYKPICRKMSVLDYFPDFCEKLDFNDEQYQQLVMLAESMISKNKEIEDWVPQTAAAGLLKYYMKIHGFDVTDKSVLAKATNRSDTTIETMYKRICELAG